MTGFPIWVKHWSKNIVRPEQWPGWLRIAASLVLGALLLYSIASSLILWPKADEADYLLQAKHIVAGQLPYRDFFIFTTPLGQMLSAALIWLMGVNVLGIRLVILALWIIEWLMLARLAKNKMPFAWIVLMLGFLWSADSRYLIDQHHFWSGFFALVSVYHLSQWISNNRKANWRLVWTGVFCSLSFWSTQSLGGLLSLSLLAFAFWDSLTSDQNSPDNFRRRFKRWAIFSILPALFVCAIAILWLYTAGIMPDFLRDTLGWLSSGHYTQTTTISPWATLSDEWDKTVLPLVMNQMPWPLKGIFIPRAFIAVLVALIFVLPFGVLLWSLFKIGQAFLSLLKKRDVSHEDRLWTLWAFSSAAMIISTFTYATSMHIASNCGLPYMLAFTGLYHLAGKKRLPAKLTLIGGNLLYGLVLIGVIIGSWMQFNFGYYLPAFRPMQGGTLFIDGPERGEAVVNVINVLNKANQANASVLVLYQSPELYLAGDFENITRYTLVVPFYTSKEQIQDLLGSLKKNPPVFVIDDHSLAALKSDPRFSKYSPNSLRIPEIESWLSSCYQKVREGRFFTLYQQDSIFAKQTCQ